MAARGAASEPPRAALLPPAPATPRPSLSPSDPYAGHFSITRDAISVSSKKYIINYSSPVDSMNTGERINCASCKLIKIRNPEYSLFKKPHI
ncbi:hypothetical protein AVEN_263716-1 [Araneus ventricosus]|uniref:Uncharacterized protein n=1 Tax=Araneus ventricosus TaxID=182803 RepID=A0A4Y2ARQ0_ARAVE|nr:hypothetical protein AVEN_263716-1 [Araneus ventricosus]